ncbi:hypothetical protein [Sulfuritalea sp.]|uniref:hypothetical protein n=1 Tax=Sulfuritalea sp. TaxID=2480090 RepID=UPI00286DA82F|nr:hypothetical protein [Sulfuritalea sp.]
MIKSTRAAALVFMLAALCAGPASATATADLALLKDLTAVVVLLGLPCDRVVGAARQADGSHIAACRNGKRYRVFINAEGRVVAHKQ